MVARNYQKSRSQLDGFLNWLKSNWIVVLGAFFIVPFLYRYLIDQKQQTDEKKEEIKGEVQVLENVNPETRKSNADKITTRTDVQNAASDLAHHLGTKYNDAGNWYDFLNPRGWTENDKQVLKILKYQVYNFHLLNRLYYEVYSKRRNLKDDVNKLLDTPQLVELKEYYKQHNRVW